MQKNLAVLLHFVCLLGCLCVPAQASDEAAENDTPDAAGLSEEQASDWNAIPGPFLYENEDYHITFDVPEGCLEYLEEGLTPEEAYFYTANVQMRCFTFCIYGCWASLSNSGRAKIDPEEVNLQYFTPDWIEAPFSLPTGCVSRARYGEMLYFTWLEPADEARFTPPFACFLTIRNGYFYLLQLEALLTSVRFEEGAACGTPLRRGGLYRTRISRAHAARQPSAPLSPAHLVCAVRLAAQLRLPHQTRKRPHWPEL